MMKKILLIFCAVLISLVTYAAGSIQIDGVTYNIDTLQNFKVGPGSQYTSLKLLASTGKRLDVFFTKVDISNPYVEYRVALGRDSIYNTETPTSVAKRKTKDGSVYFAGTNGDFYSTGGTVTGGGDKTYSIVGLPVGGAIVEGQLAHTPNNTYKPFAINKNKVPYIGIMNFTGSVTKGGSSFPIKRVNHTRGANELIFYNQHNGKITRTNQYGTEVLCELVAGHNYNTNGTFKLKVLNIVQNVGGMTIPAGNVVLSGNGTAQTFLNTLVVGEEIEVALNVTVGGVNDDFSNGVGGDPRALMLNEGVLATGGDVWNELHPRTAIGYSQDKKTVIQCVVDGRGSSAGVTTYQLAQLMVSAGAYTAVNIDGGGSSCMYIRHFDQMNQPSDGTERAVSNSVFAVCTAPVDNTISEIQTYNTNISLPKFGVYMPKVLGYNQYGLLLNPDLSGITLSCTPDMGYIAPDGRFVAAGNNGGKLTISYGGITTTVNITLVAEAEISMGLDSILIDGRRNEPILVQSVIGKETLSVLPAALTWVVRDNQVCTAEQGILKGLKNGKTWVVGNLGAFKDSVLVTVEIANSGILIQEQFDKPENWSINAQANWNLVLNSDNRPSNWSYGGVLNYTYQTNRAPMIKMTYNNKLYSLPDSVKLVMNAGNIGITKASLGLRANNATATTSVDFTSIPKNADHVITLDMDKLFETTNIAIYPITFEYITFYISASSQTVGTSYALGLKELTLYYDGIAVGVTNPTIASQLVVYPNPVKNGTATVVLNLNKAENVSMQLYTLGGQLIRSEQLGWTMKEATLPLQGIAPGTYLVKINQGERSDFVKVIIK